MKYRIRFPGVSSFVRCLVCAASAAPAHGALVTFAFAGEIMEPSGDVAFLGGSITPGTAFSGSYTFDTAAEDMHPEDPNYGHYFNALTAFSLQVGPHSLTGGTGVNDEIEIGDDFRRNSTADRTWRGLAPYG